MSEDDTLRAFFAATADCYETEIVPAFKVFAEAVVETAQPRGDEKVLDVGTGTGILARLIAPQVREVVGIDFVPAMIEQARTHLDDELSQQVHFEVGHAHHLTYQDNSFDLVVSSFGLNATIPTVVFPEIRRVLQPNGTFVFHEWAAPHLLDALMTTVIDRYKPEGKVSSSIQLSRDAVEIMASRWDHTMINRQEIEAALRVSGFSKFSIWQDAVVDCALPPDTFLSYKLSWTDRRTEIEAMERPSREACLRALREKINDAVGEDGLLHYQPQLFRVKTRL
jgi:ubiquinone/menaquinone biosynthesis C-methylase UbiE